MLASSPVAAVLAMSLCEAAYSPCWTKGPTLLMADFDFEEF